MYTWTQYNRLKSLVMYRRICRAIERGLIYAMYTAVSVIVLQLVYIIIQSKLSGIT